LKNVEILGFFIITTVPCSLKKKIHATRKKKKEKNSCRERGLNLRPHDLQAAAITIMPPTTYKVLQIKKINKWHTKNIFRITT
jgi:adenosylmethionine-8-amino-7-oxononanoate aminotransferase